MIAEHTRWTAPARIKSMHTHVTKFDTTTETLWAVSYPSGNDQASVKLFARAQDAADEVASVPLVVWGVYPRKIDVASNDARLCVMHLALDLAI